MKTDRANLVDSILKQLLERGFKINTPEYNIEYLRLWYEAGLDKL